MADLDELERLFGAYLEGEASPEQIVELERLILADDDAADRTAQWSLTHRQIADLLTEQSLHEVMSQYAHGGRELPRILIDATADDDSPFSKARGATPSAMWRGRRFFGGMVAAAAMGLVMFVALRKSDQRDVQVVFAPGATPTPAATVTRLEDAVWTKGCPPVKCGEQLYEGRRLVLDAGLMKVTFDCGAEIMLQGPCDFTVRDKMVGVLKSGKIAANVPRRAFSFAVLSPGVDFVDLGTSFGVSVDAEGHSDLRVFEGEVLCSPNGGAASQTGEALHVEATNAVAFNSVGEYSTSHSDEISYSPLRALRNTTSTTDADFDGADLALWLKADQGVHVDGQQRISSWQDVLFGGNHAGEDATQVDEACRPRLEASAIHGRPAARFDGASNYLVTTPLETTDDQTVFIVCQFSRGALDKSRKWGGQIINYDGPPGREASNMMAPGVLQIGEPLVEGDFHATALSAQVFAGFVGTAVIESGRVDAPPVGAKQPIVIAYRYDCVAAKSQLSVNGRVVNEARAFAPESLTSRKIIGRHAWKDLFFHGDLAELMIFNDALSDDELARTTRYLAEKYQITTDSLPAADSSASE